MGFSKTLLAKFHGIPKSHFYLSLKECEFRFKYRSGNMYHSLLKITRNHPLFKSSLINNLSTTSGRCVIKKCIETIGDKIRGNKSAVGEIKLASREK